jgi:hypothetical protein
LGYRVTDLFVVRAKIVAAAKSQLGVPYRYGWEYPGAGFDCAGLARWCCGQAGIALSGGSAALFTSSGPRLGEDAPPGCLAFFYGAPGEPYRPGHVGIVTIPGQQMIDAPFTGAVVRYDRFDQYQRYGPMAFFGYSDPAAMNERETDVMYLLECNDSPYGQKSWFTLSGGVAVHIPDPPTLNVLNAAAGAGAVLKVPGLVSWAWLSQYVPSVHAPA